MEQSGWTTITSADQDLHDFWREHVAETICPQTIAL